MHDHRTHPLLEQVPLTVSPFLNLPRATTLPYTYKSMPSALPPSVSGITGSISVVSGTIDDPNAISQSRPESGAVYHPPRVKFVVSASGYAAHPDDIVTSCRALQGHIVKLQADAEAELQSFEKRIQAQELAEKRRVAPGWLDSDARILEPERPAQSPSGGHGESGTAFDVGRSEEKAKRKTLDPMLWGGGTTMTAIQGEGVMSQLAGLNLSSESSENGNRQVGRHGHGRGGANEMALSDESTVLD